MPGWQSENLAIDPFRGVGDLKRLIDCYRRMGPLWKITARTAGRCDPRLATGERRGVGQC